MKEKRIHKKYEYKIEKTKKMRKIIIELNMKELKLIKIFTSFFLIGYQKNI
jgi:hypothetical protein